MCNAIDNAKCCTFFSIPAIIFLCIIGMLLQKQPLYIQGPTDYDAAAAGCYNAAIMYAATFVVSLGYWCYYNSKNGLPLPFGFGGSSANGAAAGANGRNTPMSVQTARPAQYNMVNNN